MKIVSNLKDDVGGILSGVDLNNVSNLYGALQRAAATIIQQAGVPDASGIQKMSLYSGVFDYPCTSDIFGSAITDLVPQGITRNLSDIVSKRSPEEFDRMKLLRNSSPIVTFVYKNGTPIIRVAQNYTIPKITLDPMTATTGWTANDAVSNLIADNSVFYQRPASLRFSLLNNTSLTQISENINTFSAGIATDNQFSMVFTVTSEVTLDYLKAYIFKTSTVGTMNARVYNITGTIGVDAIPTGAALAVSDDFDGNTLLNTTPVVTPTTFTFSGANQITLTPGNYAVTVECLTSVNWGWDQSDAADVGYAGYADLGAWTSYTGRFRYQLYGQTIPTHSGNLEKTLTSPIDLSTYDNVGSLFLAANLPIATDITSIQIRIGNNSSNYLSMSATTAFTGAFSSDEFDLIKFDLSTATETGTVDMTAVDYLMVIFNYNGTEQTNVRVGDLFIALPLPVQMTYRTTAIFMNTAGAVSMNITDDNDQILLNPAIYTILQYEAALAVLIQSGGTLASPMSQTIKGVLHGAGNDIGLYAHYRADNPSQEIRTVGSYYDTNNNYNQY